MSESATSPVGSVDHLSPPSTSSRLSDSEPDPSDLGDGEEGGGGGSGGGGVGGGGSGGMGGPLLPPSRHSRGALERSVRSDGASVSSMGSSSRYRAVCCLSICLSCLCVCVVCVRRVCVCVQFLVAYMYAPIAHRL
jgi:hypothetical protein